jgi:hypothetical protein
MVIRISLPLGGQTLPGIPPKSNTTASIDKHWKRIKKSARLILLSVITSVILFLVHWTCSITRLVIEQVLQNAPHFAIFQRKLFKNFSF